MNRKCPQIGEYDVPLPLWDDEAVQKRHGEGFRAEINEHGTLEGLIEAPRGASLSLAERALALSGIMSAYNQANKARGAKASPRALQERYGDKATREVVTNMGAKSVMLTRRAQRDFDTLTAHDAMLAAGFDEKDITMERTKLQNDLHQEYGPGNAYARDREKAVRRAKNAAPLSKKPISHSRAA